MYFLFNILISSQILIVGSFVHRQNVVSGFERVDATEKLKLGPVRGGIVDQDLSDPEFLELAWDAVYTVNSQSNLPIIPVKVLKAQTQTVKGLRTILHVEFGEADCTLKTVKGLTRFLERNIISAKNCVLVKNGLRVVYRVEVLEVPWENRKSIIASKILDPLENMIR